MIVCRKLKSKFVCHLITLCLNFSPANRMGNNTKELGKKGQRRPIVIDGCNVAYHHGRHDMFSGDLV